MTVRSDLSTNLFHLPHFGNKLLQKFYKKRYPIVLALPLEQFLFLAQVESGITANEKGHPVDILVVGRTHLVSGKLEEFHVLRDDPLEAVRVDRLLTFVDDSRFALHICFFRDNFPDTKPAPSNDGDIHSAIGISTEDIADFYFTPHLCQLALLIQDDAEPLVFTETILDHEFVSRLEDAESRHFVGIKDKLQWKKGKGLMIHA